MSTDLLDYTLDHTLYHLETSFRTLKYYIRQNTTSIENCLKYEELRMNIRTLLLQILVILELVRPIQISPDHLSELTKFITCMNLLSTQCYSEMGWFSKLFQSEIPNYTPRTYDTTLRLTVGVEPLILKIQNMIELFSIDFKIYDQR